MHAHCGPIGLLHLQRRREQRALRAAGGDLVLLHRCHHGFRAEQAQSRDLRCGAVHAQAQCTQGLCCSGGQPALPMAGRLCIVCEILPAALRVLRLQSSSAARTIRPFHYQASRGLRAGQGDLKRVSASLSGRHCDRATPLPERRCLRCIDTADACAERAVQRLHLEDRHAPVGGALRAGQPQVARLPRREVQRFHIAQRIGHGVRGLPLLAVQRGLQRIAFRVGDIPGEAYAGHHRGGPQIDLEPVAGAEGAAGDGLRVAVDQVADRHRRYLLRGTAGLPLAARGEGLCLCAGGQGGQQQGSGRAQREMRCGDLGAFGAQRHYGQPRRFDRNRASATLARDVIGYMTHCSAAGRFCG